MTASQAVNERVRRRMRTLLKKVLASPMVAASAARAQSLLLLTTMKGSVKTPVANRGRGFLNHADPCSHAVGSHARGRAVGRGLRRAHPIADQTVRYQVLRFQHH